MNGFDISTISSVYVGSTQYSSIYKGSTLIWPINQQLPYDAEIEYLESSGTLFIKTGVDTYDGDFIVNIDGSITELASGNNYTVFFGSDSNLQLGVNYDGKAFKGNGSSLSITYEINTRYLIEGRFSLDENNSYYYVNNSDTGLKRATIAYASNCLFAAGYVNASKYGIKAKIYKCTISRNNVIIKDFIPVRIGLTGYMYDKVSGQLFGNQGTGDFILGRDKLPNGYTEVEYISSTNGGNLYIDLGIKLYEVLNTDYDIAIKFVISSTNTEGLATIFNCLDPNNSPWPGTYIRKNNSGSNVTGRYIGGSAKDNTIGQLNNIIELPVLASPNKNVTNINNNNSTHQYGAGLFCSFSDTNNTPQRYCNGTIYYFKLFVNGALVRDLIPCKNPSNVVGLYDLVNDVFYSSPNGNSFVAGPEIN